MSENSKIEWTDSTWNPTSGCTEVSPGCDHCYAKTLAERWRGGPAFPVGFDFMVRSKRLREPVRWKEPRRVFVNSMSDLFHIEMPPDHLRQVWDVMVDEAPRHIYQILTKRPHRAKVLIESLGLDLAPNIWIGTSVENQKFADNRIPALLEIPAAFRFLSCEPLLGPVDLSEWLGYGVVHEQDLSNAETGAALQEIIRATLKTMGPGIHWVIAGGESGAGRRPADYDWFRAIRDQCVNAGVPYFHKQGNANGPGQDRVLDGRTWDEEPVATIEKGTDRAALPPALL